MQWSTLGAPARNRRIIGGAILVASGLVGLARDGASQPVFRDGAAGFVVSRFGYALSRDAEETGACPDGMTEGYESLSDVFWPRREPLPRKPGEEDDDYRRREFGRAFADPEAKNLCLNPELGPPDPKFRTVTGAGVPVDGIDLDGRDSSRTASAVGSCAHDDFVGLDGARGVDNQWFRVVGCSPSFQSTGQSIEFDTVMFTGAWGILITLEGVDDPENDDEVEVGIYANADPIELSANRVPLRNATYAMDWDPRFRATTRGRIEEGVLTTEPVDLRIHTYKSDMRLDRPLVEARLRARIEPDGTLSGILAGYTPVEAAYDFQYGVRNGEDGAGRVAPLRHRMITSIGQARVLGHTCEGAWHALHAHADGHPDPETGRCTTISTQYRFEAIPAFVVEAETESLNAELDS